MNYLEMLDTYQKLKQTIDNLRDQQKAINQQINTIKKEQANLVRSQPTLYISYQTFLKYYPKKFDQDTATVTISTTVPDCVTTHEQAQKILSTMMTKTKGKLTFDDMKDIDIFTILVNPSRLQLKSFTTYPFILKEYCIHLRCDMPDDFIMIFTAEDFVEDHNLQIMLKNMEKEQAILEQNSTQDDEINF